MPTVPQRLRSRILALKIAALRGGAPSNSPRREDMDDAFWRLHERVAAYTMTSPERLFAMRDATRHVLIAAIPGDIVECGVWRGGSAMIAALVMAEAAEHRRLWLYDTFEGMTEPTEHDRDFRGVSVHDEYEHRKATAGGWAIATLRDVRTNMAATGHPDDLIEFIEGPVEETIPSRAPDQIALLRLDTDWYESTRHELRHLWPRLSPGGILIIDDYGHFQGARKAVDEHFAEVGPHILSRIDYTGRLVVKGAKSGM
jgi:O-methyltransferase